MSIICQTVTALDEHTYRTQLERVTKFAERIHLDFGDQDFTSVDLLDINSAWRPEDKTIDLHLMFKDPGEVIDQAIRLEPSLIILQAEAEGNFRSLAERLRQADIKVGIALLPDTPVAVITPVLKIIDHVLIFSGNLGHFGGRANLSLLGKVSEIKEIRADIEIGWDGGINDQNARTLAVNGIDVLNVGGYIHHAPNPETAYTYLTHLT